ncbi:MAG: GNAT family N-acetyltransferase [Lachnospiraceae bacterium]|nr:GNAT family N-acetyltransferase [Lachnospiraceae bacterium]
MTNITIRTMKPEDYEEVHSLWMTIHGFGIRSMDDSYDFVSRFIRRNPTTSIVALDENEKIVGSILCGHDGRSACFYHVCVAEDYRRQGIGRAMVATAMQALKEEHVNKVTLIAYKNNTVGNLFWAHEGFAEREDVNFYEMPLNEENITRFNE